MQNISLAGVLPIHTGRGTEAERRKADERGGQNLTAQYINHTEAVIPATVQPELVVNMETPMNQPEVNTQAGMTIPNQEAGMIQVAAQEPVIPTFSQYADEEKSVELTIAEGVALQTTQYVEYAQKLLLDWSALPEQVMFAFIAKDGSIIGTTHRPEENYETDDYDMVEGQKMVIGKVGVDVRRTTLLTLTEREEVKQEPAPSLLVDVNPDVTPAVDEPQEKPYYHDWGKKRRQRERTKLRREGKVVPADL